MSITIPHPPNDQRREELISIRVIEDLPCILFAEELVEMYPEAKDRFSHGHFPFFDVAVCEDDHILEILVVALLDQFRIRSSLVPNDPVHVWSFQSPLQIVYLERPEP
jgi:hypothetical protein